MPRRRKSARGATVVAALRAVALLRRQPLRRGDLAAELGVSLSTAQRLLAAVREAGEPLQREERGREAWYSLP